MGNLPELEIHVMGCSRELQASDASSVAEVQIVHRQVSQGEDLTMSCSWEEAFENMRELERLFPEPDGSFMWVGFHGDREWQLNGMIYDRNDRIQWCELKGSCPFPEWEKLLRCFGWPRQKLVVQFPRDQFFAYPEDLEILWHAGENS